MVITRTREELYKILEEFSKKPGKLALIPTMGNLHDGHLSLIKLAKLKASKTITTIFVNPLQFGKNEDFKKYPRTEKLDIEKLKKEHCDILFIPRSGEEVFSKIKKVNSLNSGNLGSELCGKIRPGHFDGVLTVVNRLFELINPDIAVFGAKDYQQQILIKRMAKSFHPQISLIKAPIIRSKNGVALSSRNNYLSEKELEIAANLFKCLQNSVDSYEKREKLNKILDNANSFLVSKGLMPDYFELRDIELNIISTNNYKGNKVFLGSVTINNTRLIDNIEF
ncbi:MAG: pantoate--beta-alanine ligase [Alphaproteobacteria bacterium TMED199]|nr:MAG: pantoate--beta-alanine ligase [Alphaproteobacteria bacterium TMED199]